MMRTPAECGYHRCLVTIQLVDIRSSECMQVHMGEPQLSCPGRGDQFVGAGTLHPTHYLNPTPHADWYAVKPG